MTYDLPPDDVEPGLIPDTWRDQRVSLGCGCEIFADQDHNEDDCREDQADALAELEDLRHSVVAGTHACWHGYGGYVCPCTQHPEWRDLGRRCALRAGHGGEHLFVVTRTPTPILGECPRKP